MKIGVDYALSMAPASPEAGALFSRMTSPPDAARKTVIATLIDALKRASIWKKLDCLYVMAAHSAQAARLNWVADRYNLTAVANPVFTVDRGYAGDGIAAYLNTNFTPATAAGARYANGNAHVGVWSFTPESIPGVTELGGFEGSLSRRTTLACRNGGSALMRINLNGTVSSISLGGADAAAHLVLTTPNTSSFSGFRNGALLGTGTYPAPGDVPPVPLYLLATNVNNIAAAECSPRQLGVAHIGASLAAQEVSHFHAALSAYLVSVGALQ